MDREESDLLPGGLVTCLINENEVTVTKLSPYRLTIRLYDDLDRTFGVEKKKVNVSKHDEVIINKKGYTIKAAFYKFKDYKYKEVEIDNYEIIDKCKNEFYITYTLAIKSKEYEENVRDIFIDYSRYVMLKNYGVDNEYSEEMVGYPAENDYEFYSIFSEQKREWLKGLHYDDEYDIEKRIRNIELAVSLHDDIMYKKFMELNMKSFKDEYLRENYLEKHELFNKDITRVYIGNEFCHNLFPKTNLLINMMNKAQRENLNITLCFTYMRDCLIEKTTEIINKIYSWCLEYDKQIEIVINDWGMIELLRDKLDYIKICLGVLLNKRKKDPRYIYKKGYEENKDLMAENSLNSSVFSKFLRDNKIERYEYESCGYRMDIAQGKHSIHMPFYVTNTSQYCPLYSMCKYQDRGKQELVLNCPQYCRDYFFAYPKHLKMVGRYNSLFAFDDTLLKNKEKLNYYLENGIDRIVMNFM